MRGRQPPGPEFVYRLQGSAQSKQRACVILQTLAGQLSLEAASAELVLSTQRLHELRQRGLQALVDSLEAQSAGRPRHTPAESAEVAALRAEVARLRQELQAAQLRNEIAALLPGRPSARRKKTPRRRP
jgi:HAMP domain-containing protein